jgi:hypothetical protein
MGRRQCSESVLRVADQLKLTTAVCCKVSDVKIKQKYRGDGRRLKVVRQFALLAYQLIKVVRQ